MMIPGRKNENYRYTSLKGLVLERESDRKISFLSELQAANPHLSGQIIEVPSKKAVEKSKLEGAFKGLKDDFFHQLTVEKSSHSIQITLTKEDRELNIPYSLGDQGNLHTLVLDILVPESTELQINHSLNGKGEKRMNGQSIAPMALLSLSIQVGRDSMVKFYRSQMLSKGVDAFLRYEVQLAEKSDFRWVDIQTGGTKVQSRLEITCGGKESYFELKGACRLDEKQHGDFWVRVNHPFTDTKSAMTYWNAVADESVSVFNGTIVIPETGFRTEATQQNKNMILSRGAVIDTVPKLEIATDDVKCAHGASISPVDPEQIYYLQSRGISKADAVQMVVNGFTDPVVDLFPGEKQREEIRLAISKKSGGDLHL